MRIAFITANLGHFDKPKVFVTQKLGTNDTGEFFSLADENFPPRKTMCPRMQAKVPKMFGWQLFPGFDVYVWMDASFMVVSEHAIMWLLSELGTADMALFKHADRGNAYEEAAFLEKEAKNPYIASRYAGEWLDEQMVAVHTDEECGLYAAGIFIYRPCTHVRAMMQDWWFHVTRYHINDQLSLPYLIKHHGVNVNVINTNILYTDYFRFTR